MEYKVNDKIKIINMIGEPNYNGKEGVITSFDDANQLHGTWGGCALIPGLDKFIIINTKEAQTEEQ